MAVGGVGSAVGTRMSLALGGLHLLSTSRQIPVYYRFTHATDGFYRDKRDSVTPYIILSLSLKMKQTKK